MKINNVIDIQDFKLKKTVDLYLIKTKQIDEKLKNFLEEKDERARKNGREA